jgi:hypothetical protein
MNRLYSVIILPFLLILPTPDCQVDFTCKAVSGMSKSDHSLELKLAEGSSEEYAFELYDLNTGKLVSKKSAFFSSGDSKVVFDKVKPSTYTVYFSSASCTKKRSVKGKEGIVVQ